MGWKNWSYWLRGGIIGLFIGTIIAVFYFANAYIIKNIMLDSFFTKIIYYNFNFIDYQAIKWSIKLGLCKAENCIVLPFVLLFEVIFVGAIIGFIIGKIKQRKEAK